MKIAWGMNVCVRPLLFFFYASNNLRCDCERKQNKKTQHRNYYTNANEYLIKWKLFMQKHQQLILFENHEGEQQQKYLTTYRFEKKCII